MFSKEGRSIFIKRYGVAGKYALDKSLTDERAEALHEKFKKRRRLSEKILIIGIITCIGTFVFSLTPIVPNNLVFHITGLITSLCVFFLGFVFHKHNSFMERLLCGTFETKIANIGLDIIALSPSAKAWRDEVIASKRTIRGFDLYIMKRMYKREKQAASKKEIRANRIATIEQLYGRE